MTEYRRGRPEEAERIVAAVNRSFTEETDENGKLVCNQAFMQQIMSKGYGRPDFPLHHFVAVEDGEIAAAVWAYPQTMVLGGRRFPVFGIGSVCVVPEYRHKGHMRRLMADAAAAMQEAGAVFAVLDGQRQRYGYFGYGLAGLGMTYEVNRHNFRHNPQLDPHRFTLRPAEEGDVDAMLPLWDRRPMRMERPREDFLAILSTWRSRPRILEERGRFAGYLILSAENRSVSEIVTEDPAAAAEAVAAAVEANPDRDWMTVYSVPPVEAAQSASLAAVAERFAPDVDNLFRIFAFEPLLAGSMAAAAATRGLADGELTLGIPETGETLRLLVRDGEPSVERFDGLPSLTLSAVDATERLFGLRGWLEPAGLPAGWFPLPLHVPSADRV